MTQNSTHIPWAWLTLGDLKLRGPCLELSPLEIENAAGKLGITALKVLTSLCWSAIQDWAMHHNRTSFKAKNLTESYCLPCLPCSNLLQSPTIASSLPRGIIFSSSLSIIPASRQGKSRGCIQCPEMSTASCLGLLQLWIAHFHRVLRAALLTHCLGAFPDCLRVTCCTALQLMLFSGAQAAVRCRPCINFGVPAIPVE